MSDELYTCPRCGQPLDDSEQVKELHAENARLLAGIKELARAYALEVEHLPEWAAKWMEL